MTIYVACNEFWVFFCYYLFFSSVISIHSARRPSFGIRDVEKSNSPFSWRSREFGENEISHHLCHRKSLVRTRVHRRYLRLYLRRDLTVTYIYRYNDNNNKGLVKRNGVIFLSMPKTDFLMRLLFDLREKPDVRKRKKKKQNRTHCIALHLLQLLSTMVDAARNALINIGV